MDQTIFFKEQAKVDLFDYESPEAAEEGADSPLEIADPYKLKLLAVSNAHGYLAAAFNDTIKILNVAQFESDESGDGYDCVGLVDLSETGELVVEIGLNCDQTHLVALTCSIISENEEKNFIRVYDLRTLNFAASNSNSDQYQTPYLVSRIDLSEKNDGVVDMCVSPNEPNLVAIVRTNGKIQLWNTFEAKLKVSHAHDARCICWSPKGKQLAAYCQNDRLVLLSHELEIKSSFNCPPRNLIPIDIAWLAKKQFIVSFVNDDNNPFTYYYDAITDKNTQKEHVQVKEFTDFTYTADSELAPSFEVNQIPEWGIVLYSFSKCLEINHLQKEASEEFED